MDGNDPQLRAAVAAAATTRDVTIGADCLGLVPAVLARTAPAGRYVIVADDNTWKAAGARVSFMLAAAHVAIAPPILLAGAPRVKASAEASRELAGRLREGGLLPIAVGSGVINDLVKHAAEVAGTAYVCVPTAASMDGYAASGAALRDGGFKRTLACAAPVAIVADLDIVARAPAIMGAWGYGDLVGKLVAGIDWIVADALEEEALNPGPFALVQDNLATWLGNPAGVRQGDRAAIDGLVHGLVLSGLAMQANGNSRPASGSDHQFAHLWEMEEIEVDGLPVSHGACVGVGCLSMLAAYEWLQRQDMGPVDPARLAAAAPSPDALQAEVARAFPLSFMAANAAVETAAKVTTPARLEARLRRLQARWPEIVEQLRQRLPPAAAVRGWLEAVGGPASAAALGISPEKHAHDHARARMIRRRFTGLDVLHDLGWLETAVAELFAPRGFWFNTGRKS